MNTASNTETLTIRGFEDSDGERCECCGTPCPKRRVVLRRLDGGEDVRYGSQCAALALRGSRDRKATESIDREAEIVGRVRRWAEAGYGLDRIAKGIAARFGRAIDIRPNGIHVDGIGLIELTGVA
jgi:hypothetical protein